ncbi:MAG: ABC transporter ATP-binding protein [Rhodovulum sp.]
MAQVTLEGVNKHYGADQALFDISLDIPDGAFAVFVGPSGCGKSTLLRSIAGLEGISSGRIAIGGDDVTGVAPSDRNVAMVFQSYALYPHMSVRENMDFGMKVNGFDPATRAARIAEAARILQLTDYLDRKPGQLSGGQRQRVAIGRAIVKQPRVFLFDEPLSNLDAKLRIQMRVELETLHRELGATMIYVTHDQVEAMTMADVIVVLNGGRIEQVGAPMELYHKPATEFVAGFIGAPSMNFLDVEAGAGGTVAYRGVPLGAVEGTPARVGIRPEHVTLAEAGAGLMDVTVRVKEALGGESYLYTRTGAGDEIVVRADGETAIAPGDTVGLGFPEGRLHFFARDGARVGT